MSDSISASSRGCRQLGVSRDMPESEESYRSQCQCVKKEPESDGVGVRRAIPESDASQRSRSHSVSRAQRGGPVGYGSMKQDRGGSDLARAAQLPALLVNDGR